MAGDQAARRRLKKIENIIGRKSSSSKKSSIVAKMAINTSGETSSRKPKARRLSAANQCLAGGEMWRQSSDGAISCRTGAGDWLK